MKCEDSRGASCLLWMQPWAVYMLLLGLKVLAHLMNALHLARDWQITYYVALRNEVLVIIIQQWLNCLFVVHFSVLASRLRSSHIPERRNVVLKLALPAVATILLIVFECTVLLPNLLGNIANPIGTGSKILEPLAPTNP